MSVSFSWSKAGDAQANTQPTVGATPTVPVADQLQRVHDAWNPQSPNCAFQHYFYNRVPADQAARYVMPPGQDPQRWEQAMMTRPDPSSVPVLAVGFNDLQKRVNQQNQQVNAYRVRMHEINDKLVELSNRHDLHTTVKLLEMRERHSKLARRALALAIRIQVLSNRGHVLSPQEELFQRMVRDLIKRADDPAVFGSLNEAWARIKSLKERQPDGLTADSASEQGPDSANANALNWDADREQLERIIKVLAAQQKGITFLAQLIEDDTQSVDEQLGLAPKKPKQKAVPATAVAPQAFAAQVPSQAAQQPTQQPGQQPGQLGQQPGQNGGLLGQPNQGGLNQGGLNQGGGMFGQSKPNLFGSTAATGQQGQSGTGMFGQKPLFGAASQGTGQAAQPGQSSGLFGAKPAGQTSMFGSSQPAGQTSGQTGGLFGQNNQTQPAQGVGLFGQNNQNQNQNQPAQSGGLFGQSNQTQPAQSGGLFGQSNQTQPAQSSGLFGQSNQTQPAQSSGLFGQNNQAQPAQSGGLFGQNNQAQPAQSGGLFGQSNQAQGQSGGLFGQNNSQPQTGQTGSLFGQNQANNTQPSGGLFGQNNQSQATTGGMFGQSNQNNSFGAQNSGTGGGMFGKSTGTGLFGSSQPSQPNQPAFGQVSSGLFGAR